MEEITHIKRLAKSTTLWGGAFYCRAGRSFFGLKKKPRTLLRGKEALALPGVFPGRILCRSACAAWRGEPDGEHA
jgi:hypothetical protein